ncbi:TPA: putative quinol monooxygenase [Vibrio parahaemolyticus]
MIHLTATFHAQPGKEQQLKEVLTQALEPTRNEDGCVRYQLFQDKDNASYFVFQEQFIDQEAFEFHGKTEHFARLINQIENLLECEPKLAFFNEL